MIYRPTVTFIALIGLGACTQAIDSNSEGTDADALRRARICRGAHCAAPDVPANLGDCGVASIEMPNPFVAGSGADIVTHYLNTTSTDLVCNVHFGIMGPQRQADGRRTSNGGGWAGTTTVRADSTLADPFNPEAEWLRDGASWVLGETYTVEACSYSVGVYTPAGIDWQFDYDIDQDESNRCKTITFTVTEPVPDVPANLGDCGVASIEMPNPFVAGSGADIVTNYLNTTSTDLVCNVHFGIMGPQRQADGRRTSNGGGWAGTTTVRADSTLADPFNPEADWLRDGASWVLGETYTVEACSYSVGVYTPAGIDWQFDYDIDQDESNRCKTITFTVAN